MLYLRVTQAQENKWAVSNGAEVIAEVLIQGSATAVETRRPVTVEELASITQFAQQAAHGG